MGINVGDVVLTFLGDTTQLHQAFEQVEAEATQRISPAAAQVANLGTTFTTAGGKAAESALALKGAQLELKAALEAVLKAGGQTTENLTRLAVAEQKLALAANESKVAQQELRVNLGLTHAEGGLLAETLGEVQSKMFAMLGALAVVEMFKGFTEEVIHSIVELDNLHLKTGINIQTLAGLEHVAKETGVQFEAVSTALTRLGRAHTLALEGNKQMIAAFARIGISVNELKTLGPEELFFRVAKGMHEAKNAGDAVASATACTYAPSCQRYSAMRPRTSRSVLKSTTVHPDPGSSSRKTRSATPSTS